MHTAKVTKKSILASYQSLAERSRLDVDFILLTVVAAAICAFGFKMNSAAVVIGAMVISPLIYPVVTIGVASYKRDGKTLIHGLITLVIGLLVAIGVAAFINLFSFTDKGSEIIDRLVSSPVDYFVVAFLCGLAGTFAYFWPDITEAVAGIAISVALIPPVVLMGVGLARLDVGLITASGLIFIVNILGIYLGSLIMFGGLQMMAKRK